MTIAYNLSQLANFVNSSGQLDASTGLTNTSSIGFPTGTLMLFQQTAAPTGWTKITTQNDKALRVTSGTASTGGTTAFTTVFANKTPTITVAGTTISTSQMPSHSHGLIAPNGAGSVSAVGLSATVVGTVPAGSLAALNGSYWYANFNGGGGSHSHTATSSELTLNVQYVDIIIAQKI